MRKKILIIYGAVIGTGMLYYLWGTLTGMFLSCFYYENFGIICPACGASRMFVSLLQLDLVSAFCYNPGLFIVFIYWNVIGVLAFVGKPQIVIKPQFLYTSLGVSVALFLILGFIRNIC